MKQIFLTLTILASICQVGAQTIGNLTVEPSSEEMASVYSQSCTSPSQGVLVFKSIVDGLNFAMFPSSRLINLNHNRQRNEYVLCVEPTDDRQNRYRITITHPQYEAVVYFVMEVAANQAQIFRVNGNQASIGGIEANISGDMAFNNGNFAQAERDYNRAVEADPKNPVFIRNLANTYLQLNKNADAILVLQQGINLRPMHAEFYNMLGRAYEAQGEKTEATNNFKKAVDLTPNNTQYRNDFQRVSNPSNDNAKSYADKGDTYFEQNRYMDALGYYKQALQIESRNAVYQTKVSNTEICIKQQRYMSAADAAFNKADYQQAMNEVVNAQRLGPLPAHMQQDADRYTSGYKNDIQNKDAAKEVRRTKTKNVFKSIGTTIAGAAVLIVGAVAKSKEDGDGQ